MKYLGGLHILKSFKQHRKFYSGPNPLRPDARPLHFPKLYVKFKRQDIYVNATYIALKSLPELLRRSAASDQLVTFATAEKPFSQRAFQYPAYVEKCKEAINAYLTRVLGPPETPLNASGA